MSADILACNSAFNAVCLGSTDGLRMLKKLKVDTSSIESIRSAINRKETKLNLLKLKETKTEKKEAVLFASTLAAIQLQLPFQLDTSKMSLEKWIELVKKIREKNKAEQSAREGNKNRKRKR